MQSDVVDGLYNYTASPISMQTGGNFFLSIILKLFPTTCWSKFGSSLHNSIAIILSSFGMHIADNLQLDFYF